MSKELKYKDGQCLQLNAIVSKTDDSSVPYCLNIGGLDDYWFSESELDAAIVEPNELQPIQSQTIDRAQMAAMIYGGVMKSSESESAKDILKILGKENETYKYPEHWIEYNAKMAVLHADAIISELTQNSK